MASSIRKSFAPRRIVLWLCLICFSMPALRADLDAYTTPKIKKKATGLGAIAPSAMAEASPGEVNRGGEVTLRLRGIASGGGQVEFRLQQKPQHGKILRSKPIGLDTLEVVYRHSGESQAKTDSLVFAVRAGGVGPFSPGQANIQIKDVGGRLLVPEALEFPAVLVGKTASDSFVLANEGGATLSGTMEISAPWQVAEPRKYSLAPGEKRRITVEFAPDRGGPFQGRLVFQGSGASVELTGQGTAPFAASPAQVTLLPDANGRRVGVVSLQNNTGGPVEITSTPGFSLPQNVTLQFGETRELTLLDEGIGLVNATVTFSSGAFTTRVTVNATETTRPQTIVALNSPTPAPPRPPPAPAVFAASTPPVAAPESIQETAPPAPAQPGVLLSARILPQSDDAILIEWDLPKTATTRDFAVQQRILTLNSKRELKLEWIPVPEAKLSVSREKGTARIGDLDPATNFTFRIAEKGGENSPSVFSQPLSHRTPPPFWKRLDFSWLIYLAVGALLFFVARNRWRTRSQSW